MVSLMVCGSRNIQNVKWIEHQIVESLKEVYSDQKRKFGFGDTDFVIIQGVAKGVDKIAKDWAERNNVLTWDFPADWEKYGKGAGFIRNEEMVQKCDYCLILWDGNSHGTKNDIDLCEKYNKPYKLIYYPSERFVKKNGWQNGTE